MGFDVMREPWIDCVGLDGRAQTLGIHELLLRAHELWAIRDASPLLEYGIYRLLTVMTMDMLQPQTVWDVQDLLEKGRFEESELDAYIAACEKDGPRFDLFDPVHPFLQDAFDPRYDGEDNVKPVAVLLPELPSGNNHLHFDHRLADTQTASYPLCAKALCAANLGCFANRFYGPTINGAPPLFVLVKGKTLYDMVVSNSLCRDAATSPTYNTPPPTYRTNEVIVPGESRASVSLLEGMTFKVRRITISDAGQSVCRVFYQDGAHFKGGTSWRDPHTVTLESGRALPPDLTKELWRSVATIFGHTGSTPLALQQYRKITSTENIPVCIYGIATDKGKYLGWLREEMSMPLEVVNSDWRMQMVTDAIALTEEVAKLLKTKLRSICIGEKATWEEMVRVSAGKYYVAVRALLFTSFVPSLLQCNPDTAEPLVGQWKKQLQQAVLSVFVLGADQFGSSARILSQVAGAENDFRKRLNKILFKEAV